MNHFITVHSMNELQSKIKTGVSYLIANIPIENKQKVLDIYGDETLYLIEYHNSKYNTNWVI